MQSLTRMLIACLSCIAIVSCGGGGGSAPPVTNASPGGIWTGTDSISGLLVVGLVDEQGEFHFIRTDGVQYVGTVATNGNSISATFNGYTEVGTTFSDGSTSGTGSLSGTIAQRSSITSTTQFKTSVGTSTNGTLDLTFNTLYNTASSLATISGNYTDPNSSDVISVSGSGVMSWQDPTTGCVGNGTVTIINASYNAYGVLFDYQNCTGAAAVLNGVQFSGLATLNTSSNPEQVLVGVTGTGGGVTYSLVFVLNRS